MVILQKSKHFKNQNKNQLRNWKKKQKNVKKVLAELVCRGLFEEVVRQIHTRLVEFSSKITGQFVIQPEHLIVEIILAWLNWPGRLSTDFEQKCIYCDNIIRIRAASFVRGSIPHNSSDIYGPGRPKEWEPILTDWVRMMRKDLSPILWAYGIRIHGNAPFLIKSTSPPF